MNLNQCPYLTRNPTLKTRYSLPVHLQVLLLLLVRWKCRFHNQVYFKIIFTILYPHSGNSGVTCKADFWAKGSRSSPDMRNKNTQRHRNSRFILTFHCRLIIFCHLKLENFVKYLELRLLSRFTLWSSIQCTRYFIFYYLFETINFPKSTYCRHFHSL